LCTRRYVNSKPTSALNLRSVSLEETFGAKTRDAETIADLNLRERNSMVEAHGFWVITYLVDAHSYFICKLLRTCRHSHDIQQDQRAQTNGVERLRAEGEYGGFLGIKDRMLSSAPHQSKLRPKSFISLSQHVLPRPFLSLLIVRKLVSTASSGYPPSSQLSHARSAPAHYLQVPRNSHCLSKQLDDTALTALLTEVAFLLALVGPPPQQSYRSRFLPPTRESFRSTLRPGRVISKHRAL
jgi:hypothetical protein